MTQTCSGTALDPTRVPALLLCLQGLSVAAAVCQLAFRRAKHAATALESHIDNGAPFDLVVELLSDVWTFVDHIHRYRELIDRAPYLPKNDPIFRVFLDQTQVCEELRHYVQHLKGRVTSWNGGSPLWGSVAWVSEADRLRCFSLTPIDPVLGGSGASIAFDNLLQQFNCRFQVEAGGHRLELDTVLERMSRLDEEIASWSQRIQFTDGRAFIYRPDAIRLISAQVVLPSVRYALPK